MISSRIRSLFGRRRQVFRLAPCDLVPAVSGSSEDFEIVWGRLPHSGGPDQQSFTLIGDFFLKGAWSRFGFSLRRWWRAMRIRAEVNSLRRMRALGAPVPEIVAWGQDAFLGLALRAFVIEERLDRTRTLDDFFRTGAEADLRCRVLGRVSRAVTRLHDTGIFHRDLALRNLLVRIDAGEPEIYLIDCPRAERGWLTSRIEFLRRADALRLARGLVRRGVTSDEVRLALPALPRREAEQILDLVRPGQRDDWRRGVRTSLFLWCGRWVCEESDSSPRRPEVRRS